MNEGNPKNMKNRILVLVNPVNPVRTGLAVYKSSRYPPIGLGIVAALTPEQWDIVLLDDRHVLNSSRSPPAYRSPAYALKLRDSVLIIAFQG